jgi:hypothetical protein
VSICGFFLFEIIRIFGQKQRQILGLLVNSRILGVRKHLFFAVVDEAGDFAAEVFSVSPGRIPVEDSISCYYGGPVSQPPQVCKNQLEQLLPV